MLHAAIRRVVHGCGDAQIELLKPHPAFEAAYDHAGVVSVNREQRSSWRFQRSVWSRLDQLMPGVVDHISLRYPRLKNQVIRTKMDVMGYDTQSRETFVERFKEADALIVSGGGFMTDLFRSSERVLNVIMLALSRETPVFMFGQGIGPIHSQRLKSKAKRVLPSVESVSLREKKFSYPLLRDLGVPADRITVTGDDAVALAYSERSQSLGDGIGVNLRVASYSEVKKNITGKIGEVLSDSANSFDAELLPVPIAYKGSNSDVNSIRMIFEAVGRVTDGGASFTCPEDVIRQAGKCRVVVTGSYHGGVFALSQGVPVIGLANSEYYHNKFHGLADMFGGGCTVLRTDRTDFVEALAQAVRQAWRRAPEHRPHLLEAAKRQIETAEAAYDQMFDVVRSGDGDKNRTTEAKNS